MWIVMDAPSANTTALTVLRFTSTLATRVCHIFRLDGGMGQLGVGWPAWPWHQRTDVVKGIVGAEISCKPSVAER